MLNECLMLVAILYAETSAVRPVESMNVTPVRSITTGPDNVASIFSRASRRTGTVAMSSSPTGRTTVSTGLFDADV